MDSIAIHGGGARSLAVDFRGGRLTNDGGLAWLAEADPALQLPASMAEVVRDWHSRRGQHEIVALLCQRVYQIARGNGDQDDATVLRADPLLKQVCGRQPVTGADLANQVSVCPIGRLQRVLLMHRPAGRDPLRQSSEALEAITSRLNSSLLVKY
jgi:hypothetical protein